MFDRWMIIKIQMILMIRCFSFLSYLSVFFSTSFFFDWFFFWFHRYMAWNAASWRAVLYVFMHILFIKCQNVGKARISSHSLNNESILEILYLEKIFYKWYIGIIVQVCHFWTWPATRVGTKNPTHKTRKKPTPKMSKKPSQSGFFEKIPYFRVKIFFQ